MHTRLNLSRGSYVFEARFMKYGKVEAVTTQLVRAVFGTQDLMGMEILVRLKEPLRIFLPINFSISLPTDLNF